MIITFNNIKAIIIFDLTGNRVLAKYYDGFASNSTAARDTKKFERQLFVKTRANKTKDDICVIDNLLAVHRLVCEHHIYIVGSRDENPLLLDKTLNCIVEVVNTLINRNPDHKTFHDNLSQIILALDEICEQGTLFELDPNLVIDRVCLEDGLSEHTLASVLQSAAADIWTPWMRS